MFSPAWFLAREMCSEQEAAEATVNIIHNEWSSMRIGTKTVQAHEGRFSVESSEAPWISLADFLLKMLHDALSATPVVQMGINRQVHFSVGSEEKRTLIGRRLAPLEPWGEWKSDLMRGAAPIRSGLRSLVMQETKSPEGPMGGHIQARVEPSYAVARNTSIFVAVNDHYQLREPSKATDCSAMMEVLATGFEPSIARSEWIIDQIMAVSEQEFGEAGR